MTTPTPPSPQDQHSELSTQNSSLNTGPQITISLNPALITLLAAPATVALTMLLAWLLLTTLAIPLHPREMLAAAILNTVGGMAASLPLFLRMNRGAVALAQAGLIAIAVRMGTVFLALLAASAPPWQLTLLPLVAWTMGFYFPLLITESALVAWLIRKAKH